MTKMKIKSSKEMIEFGFKLGALLKPGTVLCLDGDLGAGKTTLTKGIGKALGIEKIINSPTFTILKTYEGKINLYHLDAYRIENEMDDFFLEEYFYLDGITVIEWSERIKSIIPKDHITLKIASLSENEREVSFSYLPKDYSYLEKILK